MSFAEEIAQSRSSAKTAPTAPPVASAAESASLSAEKASAAPAAPQAQETGFAMPEHGSVYTDALEAVPELPRPVSTPIDAPAVSPEPPAVDPAKAAPIKIGSREFTDIQAAIEYARELETSKVADQAFIEGVKTATKKNETPEVVETPAQKLARDIFVDPVKAAEEFQASLEAKLRKEYDLAQAAQFQATQVAKQRADAWDNFYKENPDLSAPETRRLVEGFLLQDNMPVIGQLTPKAGLDELAKIARKTLRIQKEASVPSKTLHTGPVVTTGATGAATNEPAAVTKPEIVDFVAQVNSLRRKSK